MRVGLFGGTFDPAHAGHAHVAETARKRIGLDRVIWLATPQNPLKAPRAGALCDRLASARRLARGRSMIVSDAEARLGSAYTVDTLRALKARYPAVRFVWIMGGDSLAGFHRWRGWRDILRLVPVAVVARPATSLKGLHGPMAVRFASARIASRRARSLPDLAPPAWVYLEAPLNLASSTALRGQLAQAALRAGSVA